MGPVEYITDEVLNIYSVTSWKKYLLRGSCSGFEMKYLEANTNTVESILPD